MKRLSYILLAAMLVAALAVSCTAEVIDDMNLVSVGFEGVRDDGSKGLTVAQATLDVYDSSISWTYKAYKNADDKTPATGTQTEDNVQLPGGISSGKLTLSQGVWNFELSGYVNGVLVYQGKAEKQSIKGTSAKVQIKVSPLKTEEGKGTLVFRKGIVIVDGEGKSFAANSAEYAAVDAETSTPVGLNSNQDTKVEDLKSGAYTVTVYCKDADFVYAQASAVVTIYDGLESFISGTLDENTAEAGFGVIKVDAAAGTTSQSQSISDFSEAEYIYGFSPASEGLSDTKTTTIVGSFAKTDESKEVSSIELKVYDRSSSAQRFTLSNEGAVIAGFDFTLDNATIVEGKPVTVSAYIGEGYNKEKLKVVYNGTDGTQPTVTGYENGVITFTTTHFSEYYVTTSDACVLNVDSNKQYIDLQDAIDNAKDGDTIKLPVDVGLEKTVIVDKKLVLDLDGKTISNTSDLWNESTGDWSLISVRGTGNLTITGNGTLQAKENDCFAVDVQDGAELTIEDGKFIGNIHAVYVQEGIAYINGGEYSVQQKYQDVSKAYEFVLNCYDPNYQGHDIVNGDIIREYTGSAKIVVTGGKFEKFNPADCYAEGAHTNFVAEGYGVIKNNNKYTVLSSAEASAVSEVRIENVYYSCLLDAIESSQDNQCVTLVKDISLGTCVTVTKRITIDLNSKIVSGKDLFKVSGNGCLNLCNGGLHVSGTFGFGVSFGNLNLYGVSTTGGSANLVDVDMTIDGFGAKGVSVSHAGSNKLSVEGGKYVVKEGEAISISGYPSTVKDIEIRLETSDSSGISISDNCKDEGHEKSGASTIENVRVFGESVDSCFEVSGMSVVFINCSSSISEGNNFYISASSQNQSSNCSNVEIKGGSFYGGKIYMFSRSNSHAKAFIHCGAKILCSLSANGMGSSFIKNEVLFGEAETKFNPSYSTDKYTASIMEGYKSSKSGNIWIIDKNND